MALDKAQTAIIKLLAQSPLAKKFYWSGGTALAAHFLNHRYSYDIDLFSDEPVRHEDVLIFVQDLKKKLKATSIEQKRIHDRWEFFLKNGHELRLEFVHYPFQALKKRKKIDGVLVDSIEDLGANKIAAVIERHEPKDAVDIFYILKKKKWKLSQLLGYAKKKFGITFSEDIVLTEILIAVSRLDRIKPMLFGSSENQQKQIEEIQEFFKSMAARHVRGSL